MTVVCVLVEGAETRAPNDSFQHAYQVVPISSLPPYTLPQAWEHRLMFIRRGRPPVLPLTLHRVAEPLPFQVMGCGGEGGQKASGLAASRERRVHLLHHRFTDPVHLFPHPRQAQTSMGSRPRFCLFTTNTLCPDTVTSSVCSPKTTGGRHIFPKPGRGKGTQS